jgi:hypothetical protein
LHASIYLLVASRLGIGRECIGPEEESINALFIHFAFNIILQRAHSISLGAARREENLACSYGECALLFYH